MMPRTPARACKRKKRETRDDAQQHLWRLIRLGASLSALEVYECKFCGHWHVGHRLGSGGRRR